LIRAPAANLRVVISGGPELGGGPLAQRREKFQRKFDRFRSAIVNEPRGSDVLVGALLVEPEDKTYAAGVIFSTTSASWACAATAPSD
jgi:4-hydroxyproline epimerase